jgi:hypothetical protein
MLAGGQAAAATAAAGVVLKDFSGAAAGYFGGVRIPASLIAGSSLGALFSLKGLLENMETKSPTERLVIQIYHAMVLISFILSLSTIVMATAATVTIMHGTFDVMAETAYILLQRELEFEFVSSRWAFLMSLVTFLVGVTGRVLLEFNLLTEKRRSLALGVVFSMTALVSHLFSYINSTLYCWLNFLMMTFNLIKVCCFFPIKKTALSCLLRLCLNIVVSNYTVLIHVSF